MKKSRDKKTATILFQQKKYKGMVAAGEKRSRNK
jgi:hypothetical protein